MESQGTEYKNRLSGNTSFYLYFLPPIEKKSAQVKLDRIFSANFWGNKNIPQIFETTGRKKAPEESNLAVAYISNTTKTYKFKQQSGNLHLGRGDVETKMPPYSGISDHKLVNIRQERLAIG